MCLFDSLELTDERFLVLRVNPMPNSEQTWHPSLPFWIGHTSIQARLDFLLQVAPLAARAAALVANGGCNLRRWLLAPLAASSQLAAAARVVALHGCRSAPLAAAREVHFTGASMTFNTQDRLSSATNCYRRRGTYNYIRRFNDIYT